MKVLVVEPGYLPYEKEIPYDDDVSLRLNAMQKIVGGGITSCYPFNDEVALISNDEAINEDLSFNRSVPGGYGGIFGTFFLCGTEDEHYCSLTPEQVERYKAYFQHSEILIGAVNNTPVTLKVSSHPKQPEKPHHEKNHSSPER